MVIVPASMADQPLTSGPKRASPLLKVATELGIEVVENSSPRASDENGHYFVHGTRAPGWSGKSIDLETSLDKDFGTGFYAFRDDARGRKFASRRCEQKIGECGVDSVPFLLRFRVPLDWTGWNVLNLEEGDLADDYERIVNAFRYGNDDELEEEVLNAAVIWGPTAHRPFGPEWKAHEHLPVQFCFRPVLGPGKLVPVAILPVRPSTSQPRGTRR